jgi:RNA polymerase-binding transcription factor DksA
MHTGEAMSTTDAGVTRGLALGGIGPALGANTDRLQGNRVDGTASHRAAGRIDCSEGEKKAGPPTAGEPRRRVLTERELAETRQGLERLAALETDRVNRVATIGEQTVAAYDIGVRDAVRDALVKLIAGTFGDCESCGAPIPFARLKIVPYARRCRTCQVREENGWNHLEQMVAGIVRQLAGEPQGKAGTDSVGAPKRTSPSRHRPPGHRTNADAGTPNSY